MMRSARRRRRRRRRSGHFALMGRIDAPKVFGQKNRKEEDHLEYLDVDG
jgi:hypothetical protein